MRVFRRISKVISGIGGFLMLAFAFLRWETDIAGIPGSLSEQLAFVRALPGGTVPVIVYSVIGVALVLLAIGPYRVQAWIKWVSPGHSASPASPSTAETRPSRVTVPPNATEADQVPPNRRSDVDLKERCLKLSQELFEFINGRDKDDPVHATWIADASEAELNEFSRKSSQYMNETMHLYDQQYAGRVMSLFETLEQRGLWNPNKVDAEARKRIQDPGTPYDIREIARQLSRIGHKVDGSLGQSDNGMHRAENEGSNADAEPANEKSQDQIEDLKRRCRELADELRQFLEDNENLDKEQTMRLYNRRLGDKASALLQELEEHGLYPPQNLKSYQLAANAKPLSPFAIRNLARTLGIIGHRR